MQFRQSLLVIVALLGGAAALSWEVLWQLQVSIGIGISALGAAFVLATTMGGMSLGSLLMGGVLERAWPNRPVHPVRLLGLLEGWIGLTGLLLLVARPSCEWLDAFVYRTYPTLVPWVQGTMLILLLGPATLAMGATVPVLGLIARRFAMPVSVLYGSNTLGAAAGILLFAFVVIPNVGITWSCILAAAFNGMAFVVAWSVPMERSKEAPDSNGGLAEVDMRSSEPVVSEGTLLFPVALWVSFLTGFATFALEVAWFRALRAALRSTTYSFALMLAAVLLAFGVAAHASRFVRRRGIETGSILAAAGVLILLATPLVERFQFIRNYVFIGVLPSWFLQVLLVIGPSIFAIGLILPSLLDEQKTPRGWATLYATNTFGAIVGALGTAWILLPVLGFARTAWLVGIVVAGHGVFLGPRSERGKAAVLSVVSLLVAIGMDAGIGRRTVIGVGEFGPKDRVLDYRETPDSTVTVVEMRGERHLFIDGFSASNEQQSSEYMIWMGRLPMLLHPNPESALVICFGTGKTADAVIQEGARTLDIVDISRAVVELADHFPSNHGVLDDERARRIVMDGRAWMRRTDQTYDVITLEPMPPTFSGVNSLYSADFYQRAKEVLRPGGIVVQWLPFHLVSVDQAMAIAATFVQEFDDAFLWIDPESDMAILLGRAEVVQEETPWHEAWVGFDRPAIRRTMDRESVQRAVLLDDAGLRRFAEGGTIITDDNQLLAYPRTLDPGLLRYRENQDENMERARQSCVSEEGR